MEPNDGKVWEMTRDQKYVLKYFPDAVCKEYTLNYQGKDQIWYVICCEFYKHHQEEIGASCINEELAWKNTKRNVKQDLPARLLEKLEQ